MRTARALNIAPTFGDRIRRDVILRVAVRTNEPHGISFCPVSKVTVFIIACRNLAMQAANAKELLPVWMWTLKPVADLGKSEV
jgi:hypothetical protein